MAIEPVLKFLYYGEQRNRITDISIFEWKLEGNIPVPVHDNTNVTPNTLLQLVLQPVDISRRRHVPEALAVLVQLDCCLYQYCMYIYTCRLQLMNSAQIN